MRRCGRRLVNPAKKSPSNLARIQSPTRGNVDAALREPDASEEAIFEPVEITAEERRVLRRDKLSAKLQEVFGLQEREEVLDELRCWLLRSVSELTGLEPSEYGILADFEVLKGYMYLTSRHICFFAHMPDREVSSATESVFSTY